MPRYIAPDDKLSVIEDWLDGETREDIAIKHNIWSGTVYNYVHEWSNSIGFEKAAVLRELAIQLKKNRLTVSDCAKGFRMVMIFKKYGIKEEDEVVDRVTYFLKEIYLKCQEVNLSVQKVFLYIYDIINFSRNFHLTNTPISERKKGGKRKIRSFYPKFVSKNKWIRKCRKGEKTRNTKIIKDCRKIV